ncbi:hypothetical protein BZA05DRAFT_386469 [Tricharina praecox]|uniref:uncharacterized protein n=1 Tax=Tricharina praecox TaxID=43433 RepID=UPI00221EABA3|nr:uncharacterized protein BZA05DRAFT_386469 [Tricharina praecox]KAI5856880.1 hypothetical protein BZA05DRAFT_386469 [Tricharina praecox]
MWAEMRRCGGAEVARLQNRTLPYPAFAESFKVTLPTCCALDIRVPDESDHPSQTKRRLPSSVVSALLVLTYSLIFRFPPEKQLRMYVCAPTKRVYVPTHPRCVADKFQARRFRSKQVHRPPSHRCHTFQPHAYLPVYTGISSRLRSAECGLSMN